MPIHVLNKTVYEKQNCNKQINLVGHFKKKCINSFTTGLQVCYFYKTDLFAHRTNKQKEDQKQKKGKMFEKFEKF